MKWRSHARPSQPYRDVRRPLDAVDCAGIEREQGTFDPHCHHKLPGNDLWLLSDRRISRERGHVVVRDDARKLILLTTRDAVALLGYTGLGATNQGTEPADG